MRFLNWQSHICTVSLDRTSSGKLMSEWAREAESFVPGTVCCCQWSACLSLLSVSGLFSVKGTLKLQCFCLLFVRFSQAVYSANTNGCGLPLSIDIQYLVGLSAAGQT